MKITNRQAIDLFLALKRLDGDKLDLSAQTRWKLAKNLRVTKTAARDYDKALVGLSAQHENNQKALQSAAEELVNIETELPLLKIKLSDLSLDQNKTLSVPVLEGLMPIIDDE